MTAVASRESLPALKAPPGPTGLPFLGNLPDLRADKLKFLSALVRDYGGVALFHAVIDLVVVTDPDAVKHVLQDNHLNYTKGFNYRRMEPLLGKGLLTAEGEQWRRNRRLASPAFHRQRIAGFADTMTRHTARMLDAWSARPQGQPFDAHQDLMALTLNVVGEALFSADLSGDASTVGTALTEALHITDQRFEAIFVPPQWVPTPQNLRFGEAMGVLDGLVNDLVTKRRAAGTRHDDLLGMLMEARFEGTDEGLSDTQLRDEVMTMVLAGHETTANALTWTLKLLSTHPHLERRAAAEVRAVVGDAEPTLEHLPRLPYLKQVIEESMRLYPPAWAMGRRAIEDDVVGGFSVKQGTDVMILPWMTHRDPKHWENPEGFDPDRFAPEAVARRHRFAFIPFAAGPRMCIGNAFAMMEMQLVLAMLLSRFRVDLVPGQEVVPLPQVTLRPKDGLQVTLTRREPTPA